MLINPSQFSAVSKISSLYLEKQGLTVQSLSIRTKYIALEFYPVDEKSGRLFKEA